MKQVFPIRISGKGRREKARATLLDCLHFENMLIILIREFYDKYQKSLTNISILKGLFSKKYRGKYQIEFQEVLNLIVKDDKLNELYKNLKEQWNKIKNAGLLLSVFRKIVKSFGNYFKALESYRLTPEKFRGIPRLPKPKKLKFVERYSVELVTGLGIVKQEKESVLLKLKAEKARKYLKVKLPKWFNYQVSSARLKMIGEDIWVDIVYKYPIEGTEPKENMKQELTLDWMN
jgi:hypothetical protein